MPPSSRPNAAPPAAIALQTPSAFARSSPSANVVVMIDSAAGDTSAAPRPCSARQAMSISPDCDSPLASDATVKITTPARKMRLRPNRSPARPPSSRNPPNTSVYELITHCRLPWLKSRSCLDRRQRDVRDRRVEHDHELREADEDEDEPAVGLGLLRHARAPGTKADRSIRLYAGSRRSATSCDRSHGARTASPFGRRYRSPGRFFGYSVIGRETSSAVSRMRLCSRTCAAG